MKHLAIILALLCCLSCAGPRVKDHPNVIMIMSDDLGWGDVGFNGNVVVKTPNLDKLAGKGVIFNRFYTASPVCSPTRASCLTGRNPYRMNITTANDGHMKSGEVTLAEVLRRNNYQTGHFGKWHLGTFTTKIVDSNRGRPGNYADFSIPMQHGFNEFFSTEAKVPTFDPMRKPKIFKLEIGESLRFGWENRQPTDSVEEYGTHYWNGKELLVDNDLDGDDAKIIIDRAMDFMERSSKSGTPFFAVIWLHTPHLPVVADKAHRDMYATLDLREQLYYGTISAMDEQIGRLWEKLDEWGEQQNTMLWFCSDNGPENGTPGSAGNFRERKRSLYEGGIRVPAFLVWDQHIRPNQSLDFPVVTSDYMPTILDMLEISHHLSRPMDGMSVREAIAGTEKERTKPIGFLFREKMSWMTHQYKLISVDEGNTFELYDILNDPEEHHDIAAENDELVESMKRSLFEWIDSVNDSRTGGDY